MEFSMGTSCLFYSLQTSFDIRFQKLLISIICLFRLVSKHKSTKHKFSDVASSSIKVDNDVQLLSDSGIHLRKLV